MSELREASPENAAAADVGRAGNTGVARHERVLDLPMVANATECCPGGLAEPMDRQSAEELARLFKAVADPARLQLLSLIRSAEGQQACACDLNEPLGLRQPTVSHHLKVLVQAGILQREQRGTWAWYSLVPDSLDALAAVLLSAEADADYSSA